MTETELLDFFLNGLPILGREKGCNICGDNNPLASLRLVKDLSTGYVVSCCENCFITQDRFHTNEKYSDAICPDCGNEINIYDFRYSTEEEKWLCYPCYTNCYWECTECHNLFHKSIDYEIIERNNRPYRICSRCYSYSQYLINDYSYNPEFKFYKTEKDKRTLLYFGIELEVESLGNNKVDIIRQLPDFVYVKYDSSLTDGFEIVSHPATYNWLKTNEDRWNKVLEIRKSGYKSYQTNRCDMHIHLSKKAFTPFHLHKFMVFINRNPCFSNKVGQKTVENSNPNRYRNMYVENNARLIRKAKRFYNEHDDRYVAVNLAREHTAEVRIFKGTLSPTYFWKNVEFTNLLYDFSLNCALPQMKSANFKEYLKPKQKEYPNLYNFLYPDISEFSLTKETSKKMETIENV